jgi:hypothetical protein
MNINPNLLDFERNMIYTRKRNDQQIQPTNYGLSNMNYPVQLNVQNTWDSRSSYYNKKEFRNDLQNRYSDYRPLPSAQAFPIIGAAINNNSVNTSNNSNTNTNTNTFFFNNMPLNTRLNNNQQKEINENKKI